MFIYITLRTSKIISVPVLYYACIIYTFESIYLLTKTHKNSLRSFKRQSIHRDRQMEATLFYIM